MKARSHFEICDNRATYLPDGKTVLFASERTGRSQIWTMNSDGGDAHRLHESNANDYGRVALYRARVQPMRSILLNKRCAPRGCSDVARAASGHAAAAPPSSVMNLRRFMPDTGLPPEQSI
jgi:WD40-like Beta Propeller Repeat